MEKLLNLQSLCEGNPPVTGGFSSQRNSKEGFGVFFDVNLPNGWTNTRVAGDLGRYDAHCDLIAMRSKHWYTIPKISFWKTTL